MNQYRLSLDIGTNSIGWCALDLQPRENRLAPVGIVDMGVRIFPDGRNPKSGESNAVERRLARGMRRNRDRYLERRSRLIAALVAAGLLPKSIREQRALSSLDPYALRARGISEKLSPHELGRALFHLNQRRGFKSNRKSDAKAKDSGAIKEALREQREEIHAAGASTFGEYLFRRREQGASVRARLQKRPSESEKSRKKEEEFYEIYPDRELTKYEFEILWRVQSQYHSTLTPALGKQICDIIIDQRPLKPQVVGKCTFERDEDRAPKALPVVHRLRIYQELNHLQVLDKRTLRGRPLTLLERDTLAGLLCHPKPAKNGKAELSFDKMRAALGLGEDSVFSHESETRKGLEADSSWALLSHKDRFGARWQTFSEEQQEHVVLELLHNSDEDDLIRELKEEWGLDHAHAETVSCTSFPDKYARLGRTASGRILEQLIADVIPYSEAVARAGYGSHSQFSAGAARERLPYYGEVLERHVVPDPEKGGHPEAPLEKRYGKVTNPTVHVALNQLRKVVNEVIKLYGRPAEIHVEVLRELKNSLRQKAEIQEEQAKNKKLNDECATLLREEFHLPVNRENIQRLRLWRELGVAERFCIYTGEPITERNLFTKDVEIDHILPWSRTLDDSMANKILCKRQSNRDKTNQTPYERWGGKPGWEDLFERSSILPKNKRWRFGDDAMDRYEKDKDFLARQLTDSQYIARLARAYLAVLFDSEEAHKVVCLPGRLTGLFRHHLGLDDLLDEINPARESSGATRGEKNRNDHRHHAVDALLVGVMDRAFLQRAASTNARFEKEGVYEFLDGLPEPWPEFRAQAREALAKIVVSHKLDHGIEGALHNDKPFGVTKREDPRGNVIKRVLVSEFSLDDVMRIRGRQLRAELVTRMSGLSHKEAFSQLEEFDANIRIAKKKLVELLKGKSEKELVSLAQLTLRSMGIRRVRLISTENNLRGIRSQITKSAYKFFKLDGNAYWDIFDLGNRWGGDLKSRFDANQRGHRQKHAACDESANGKRLIRLFNRDMLEMEHGTGRKIFFIQRMSEKIITLAEHFEANTDSRARDQDNPFKFVFKGGPDLLRRAKTRFLVVTPAGKIRYLSDMPDDKASG